MGNETIPERLSGQTIVKSFFNILRDVLASNHVPRNSSGVATDQAGDLGESSFRWGTSYLKEVIMGVVASGMKMSENGTSYRFDAATGKDFAFYINSVLKGFIDVDGMDGTHLKDETVPYDSRVNRGLGTSSGNISTASGSGTQVITNTTYTTVTNQTITLDTNGGSVLVTLQGSGGAGAFAVNSTTGDNQSGFVRIFRTNGASQVGETFLGGSGTGTGATATSTNYPSSILMGVDTPSAGTQTYRLEAKLFTGTNITVSNVSLVAVEL